MSDLLNQASLVMVPSGYKEDVVYSQIPTNGNGDLSFTRASNGTRINSAGLVEVCPWNLAQQSNTFGTSPWSNTLDTGATLTYTANYGTAPDGTTTAGRLQMALNGSAYAQKNQIISVITGQQYTYSVYMRSLSGTKTIIFCYDNTNNISATVTTEWQRFTHTFTGNSQVYARFVLEAGTSTSVDLLIYGAQLNIGSTAKPYFPTTDRLNVPRLTYQNGGGGCPSLLLEKQSTNLYPNSEALNLWDTFGTITVTANDAISPDGTTNADRVQFGTNGSLVYMNGTGSAGTNTLTVYAKAKSGTSQKFRFFGNGATTVSSDFTATDQWQRFEFSYTYSAQTAGLQGASTGASDVLFWGFQHEVSSYATSYIPTTSSSATRVADAMTVNLPNTNMTFTAYLECEEAPLGTTAGDWFAIYSNVSVLGRAYGYANQFGFADAYNLGVVSGEKMVWKQESGTTAKIFKNGVLVGTSTTGAYALAFNRFAILALYLDKPLKVKQFVFFDNALTDAECIQLTA